MLLSLVRVVQMLALEIENGINKPPIGDLLELSRDKLAMSSRFDVRQKVTASNLDPRRD